MFHCLEVHVSKLFLPGKEKFCINFIRLMVNCINSAQLSTNSDQIAVHLIRQGLILSANHSLHATTIFFHESVDPTLNSSNKNLSEQWSTFLDLWVKIQLSHYLEYQILYDNCCQCWKTYYTAWNSAVFSNHIRQ